jgi:hypothetical protein
MALTMTHHRPWRGLTVLLTLHFWLGVITATMAATVHCATHEDPQFKRLVTTCSDGSRAATRDDEQFKRWRTDIVKPGKAGEGSAKKALHRLARPGRLRG